MGISFVKLASEYMIIVSDLNRNKITFNTRNGLDPCICPECRDEITGRATVMESFLR